MKAIGDKYTAHGQPDPDMQPIRSKQHCIVKFNTRPTPRVGGVGWGLVLGWWGGGVFEVTMLHIICHALLTWMGPSDLLFTCRIFVLWFSSS
jgi:hypothetical protein